MKIRIEIEIDTIEDRQELDDLIEQLQHLREVIINNQEDQND